MLIGVGSVKGSPGVTTVALGLAAVWPGQRALLVEADPAGGDIAAWCETGEDPGLVSLATATRRASQAGVDVVKHARDWGNGLLVVPGPAAADQAHAAVRLLSSRRGLFRWTVGYCGRFDVVIVDLGRLDPGSPALTLLNELDVLLMVGVGDACGLAHLAARSPALEQDADGPLIGGVLTRRCCYQPQDIEKRVGLPLIAVLPDDTRTVAALLGTAPQPRLGPLRHLTERRPLMAALRRLAEQLVEATTFPQIAESGWPMPALEAAPTRNAPELNAAVSASGSTRSETTGTAGNDAARDNSADNDTGREPAQRPSHTSARSAHGSLWERPARTAKS